MYVDAHFPISMGEEGIFLSMNTFEIDDLVDYTFRSQITRYTAAVTEVCFFYPCKLKDLLGEMSITQKI